MPTPSNNRRSPEDVRGIENFNYSAAISRNLLSPHQAMVCITYRLKHARTRWTGFHLVPDEGESFESVAAKIEPAIVAHARQSGRPA